VSFTASGITVRCPLTLNAELNEGPTELSAGATLGQLTEVSIATESCGGGVLEEVLSTPWTIQEESVLGTLSDEATGLAVSIPRFKVKFSVFGGFLNCLYEGTQHMLIALGDTGTDNYGTETIRFPTTSTLIKVSGFGCPATGSFAGSLLAAPQRAMVVGGVGKIAMLCVEERGPGVVFETVNPGGISTRWLTCTYVWGGAAITFNGGSGIVNPQGVFSATEIPAFGTPLALAESVTIRLRFAPEAGAPRRTPYITDFKLETSAGSISTAMKARTN
jgi:hypothetical protein